MARWTSASQRAHGTSFKLVGLLVVFSVTVSCVLTQGSELANSKQNGKGSDMTKKKLVDEKKNASPKVNPSTKDVDSATVVLNNNPALAESSPTPPITSSTTSPLLNLQDRNASTIASKTAPEELSSRKHDDKPVIASTRIPFSTDEVTMPPVYQPINEGFTNQTDETHDYYNSTFIRDEQEADALWIELDNLNETVTHEMLSESYRRAATVNLTFDFPFYGHPINNVTIATGGFLYVGYKLHMWLAATQYIAPLMANFNASVNLSESSLKYYDNGTVFVVEWRNVQLDDHRAAGNFTFQAILHKNGDIVFVYKNIPIPITNITEQFHPVKVGISDAYLFQRTIYLMKRKTIYEYHSINKKSDWVRSHSAIIMRALPTCVSLKTCKECTTAQINFNCTWCKLVQRCSSGIDRHRQSWISSKCEDNMIPEGQCPATDGPNALASADNASGSTGVGMQALLILVALILGVAFWVFYAYRNPRSPSGQFLIKYRPSQWKRHGEARYIATGSLHM